MTKARKNCPKTAGDLVPAALSVKEFAELAGLDTELTNDRTDVPFTDLRVFVFPTGYGIYYLFDRAQIVGCDLLRDKLSLRSPDAIQPPYRQPNGEYICNVSVSDEYYSETKLSETDPQEIYDCMNDWLKRMETVRSELARLNIESSASVLAKNMEREGQPCQT